MPTLISTTGAEPVSVAEAISAARLDSDAGAELTASISGAISAARLQAEHLTGRCYRPQVQRFELDDWPAAGELLPICDPTSVAIAYWSGSAWVDLPTPAGFAWAGVGIRTGLAPATGTSWPTLGMRPVGARVRIDISAGPDSPAKVPESVKLYIKAQVSAWQKTPEALASTNLQPNPLFESLLDGERLWA
jgi:hypothetical protein